MENINLVIYNKKTENSIIIKILRFWDFHLQECTFVFTDGRETSMYREKSFGVVNDTEMTVSLRLDGVNPNTLDREV